MSGVVQWVAASRGWRAWVWPVLPEPVAHQLTERTEVGQLWLIRGHRGEPVPVSDRQVAW
jgi:hypothetical protein